jgi:hypothetical protein
MSQEKGEEKKAKKFPNLPGKKVNADALGMRALALTPKEKEI